MKAYAVIKHNADGPGGVTTTQCGALCKTTDKAAALKAKMRAIDAQRHGSSWYTIETVIL